MELLLSAKLEQLLGSELRGAAWLLTYSLHALAWATAASVLVRLWPLSSARRHSVWKAALLGPLVTAALTSSPVGFLDAWHPKPAREVAIASHTSSSAPASDTGQSVASAHDSPGLDVTEASARRASSLLDFFGGCVLAALALGLLRFGSSAVALRRKVAGREPVHDARLLRHLARVQARFGLRSVRLSQSPDLDCPLVLGVAEICVPLATLADLGDAEVDAVLAHELAHLERRDGLWFPFVGLLHSMMWWHPIARHLSLRVRQSAELACDDRCVELLGEPWALARALTQLAARTVAVAHSLPVPTMTQPRGGLLARVRHLTSTPTQADSRATLRGRVTVGASLIAAAAVSLGASVRVAEGRPSAPITAPSAGKAYPANIGVRHGDAEVTRLSRQMIELARREQELQAELAQASIAEAAGTPSPRVLELQQDLDHTQQMQLWLEQSLVSH